MVKAGQAVAARADLFPEEVVEALSRLEDRIPPRPFRVVARRIEAELGRPWPTVFSELDPEPLGAASLAQVHRARLLDGREVAVKVLYPGIEATVARDLRLLPVILGWLVRPGQAANLDGVLEEIARSVPDELDLRHEGRNAERVAAVLAHRDDVQVPAVAWEWTTRRVLVTDLVRGIKISDVRGLVAAGIDPQAVARLLVDVYCEQVFRAGVFHADPHPGNLQVLPGPRLVLLDFGLVKELSTSTRVALGQLAERLAAGDPSGAATALDALGFRTARDDPASLLALSRLFFGTFRSGHGYADPALLVRADRRLRMEAAANPIVRIPPDLVLVARVMAALSGIGKRLDSRVDVPRTILRHLE
jgi:predicted unusual protein kinase regulating ubiquinone biosynthesis (AarF/ABC1/UbiB family)